MQGDVAAQRQGLTVGEGLAWEITAVYCRGLGL